MPRAFTATQEIWVGCKRKYQYFLVPVSSTRVEMETGDRESPARCFVLDEEHHGEGPVADQQLLADLAASFLVLGKTVADHSLCCTEPRLSASLRSPTDLAA